MSIFTAYCVTSLNHDPGDGYAFSTSTVQQDTENWLLIFKAEEQRIVGKLQLESTAKIFVRNNKEYLYFGTHSEEGADGFRKWVLTGFRINDSFWYPQKMHLTNLVGYDIGSTVCFEIIDGYFYGLSNQTDFEIRETNWTSYYHCFRFRLGEPDSRKTQVMDRDDSWRRQHSEGPIDDRWGFLKLERDQASGMLHIIESRKEWLTGRSGNQRTYYTTKVVFDPELDMSEVLSDTEPSTADGSASASASTSTTTTTTAMTTTTVTTNAAGRLSFNPIGHLDRPAIIVPQFRAPENVHRGDNSSMLQLFTRSQTHLRSYARCCSTFLDLVDDPPSTSSGSRRLRIRTGYRQNSPVSFSGFIMGLSNELALQEENQEQYQPNKIYFWPPEQDPSDRNPFLDKLYEILNPPGYLGSVDASSDERSLVYATGEDANGLKVLVYVSFDPAARLAGMLREDYVLGERAAGDGYNPEARAGEITQHIGKGKEKAIGGHSLQALPFCSLDTPPAMHTIMPPPEGSRPWAWSEKAMYQDLTGKNFAFAR
ncbi:sphingolipid delta-4 desaturase [Hypoxylon texense]